MYKKWLLLNNIVMVGLQYSKPVYCVLNILQYVKKCVSTNVK